jgi:hypothetical protein
LKERASAVIDVPRLGSAHQNPKTRQTDFANRRDALSQAF